MSEDNHIDTNRLTLDGPVHDYDISPYIEQELEKGMRKPRILIALFAVLATVFFIWGAISQYKLQATRNQITSVNELKHQISVNNAEATQFGAVQDSLENQILKLKKENDLLAENTSVPVGVFFEVQIGTFTDFNLDQYNKNLANLRQEKYDGKTKFLLGRFRSFKQALLFESDLKRVGINSAFIVGRIDDKIVTYREALEALGQNNN